MSRVLALIICYFPDTRKLDALISTIEPCVDAILIVNNGGMEADEPELHSEKVRVVSFGKNVGIAMALNYACDHAATHGYRYFIGFDQDSQPQKNMILQLVTELCEWQQRGEQAVAIGPKLVDVRGDRESVAPFQRFSLLEKQVGDKWTAGPVSQLITSGCMIDLLYWRESARFNEDFFIDFVDHNWCWNMTRLGFVLIGAQEARMHHELSTDLKKFMGYSLNTYSPIRRYFQTRNATYQLLHERLSNEQRMYLLKSLVIVLLSSLCSDLQRLNSLGQVSRGIWNGVTRHLGPDRA
jgi:rhamnosyltransferase